ncbi:hypothetical protein ACIPSA_38515 [Streptomyces sp. NPDC086549]|uniref:hypothetical protein n=1 Tax=Streptomyces sp. NPDC086549 TaxID=3365752 RepID=UPI003827310C
MTWTIDEARVMPFLRAAHRRDLLARLWRPPAPDVAAGVPEPVVPAPDNPDEPEVRAKNFKDFKDSKDSKDGKDSKESKDYKDFKDYKDSKDVKDGKEGKDHKDFKDGKDFKDSRDGAWTPPERGGVPFDERPVDDAGPTEHMSAEAAVDADDILAVLRASRAGRFLRERGLVI